MGSVEDTPETVGMLGKKLPIFRMILIEVRLKLITIPINWCKEYIAWIERLEYISNTAGEMLLKGLFFMLMIGTGLFGNICLVWAEVEQYRKIWDDLYKMVLIASISCVAILGNLIREYLPVNLILVILLINVGTILLRVYLKEKFPQILQK